MNRRNFNHLLLGAMSIPQLISCGNNSDEEVIKHMDIEIPKFSKENLHKNLDRLLKAFEARGMLMDDSLLPAMTESEIKAKCSWFPGVLTEEIIALYQWRGGQKEDVWNSEISFLFRDNSFCSIERAEIEYKNMMNYGIDPEIHEMLKYSFPIAAFDGALYVIPTTNHIFNSALNRPIISVFEGIDIYYYSIEKMVETCVDWEKQKNNSNEKFDNDETEFDIWNKHNPGIFS